MKEPDVTALIPPASTSGARRGWRCPDEERLAAYVEGTLEGTLREDLEGHLADCGFCCGQVGFSPGPRSSARRQPCPAISSRWRSRALVDDRAASPRDRRGGWRRACPVAPGDETWSARSRSPISRTRQSLMSPRLPDRTPIGLSVPDAVRQTLRGSSAHPRGERLAQVARARVGGGPRGPFLHRPARRSERRCRLGGARRGCAPRRPADAGLATGQPYFAWVIAHLRSGATVRSKAVGFRLDPG